MGHPNFAESIDIFRYVFGVMSFQIESVSSMGTDRDPPHMFPFLSLGRCQCKAEEANAAQIVLDLSASDALRAQTSQLAKAQIQLCAAARGAMNLPTVEVLTPVLEMTEGEIESIAVAFLRERLAAFYDAVHDSRLNEFYGVTVGALPLFDGKRGWRALEEEAGRLGVVKDETWSNTIPALVDARVAEILSYQNQV